VGRRIALGNTRTEAIRSLRRHLSNEVYKRLCLDSREQISTAKAKAA
jgi:hypothetical protein